MQKMEGKLYGVGVGPGDAELLTLKAVRVIRECDIIGIPARDANTCTAYRIALEAVPEIKEKPVLAVPVPMTSDAQKLAEAYDEGSVNIVQEIKKGKRIAFLNLGDPSIYGSYTELQQRVIQAECPAEMISGVPSFCAVAARLGISLASREEEIHILPACYREEEIEQLGGTRVLMKPASRTGEIRQKLVELEEKGCTVTAVINCGMEQEQVYRDIRELEESAGYFTTIIVQDN